MSSRPLSSRCLRLGVDLERATCPPPKRDLLRGEVDLGLAGGRDRAALVLGQHDRQQADLRAVREEDVGEDRRDDRLEAVVLAAPTARARARTRSRSCGPATRIGLAGRSQPGSLRPVVEQELAEAGALDALEELLGDDLVGVDVVAVEDR